MARSPTDLRRVGKNDAPGKEPVAFLAATVALLSGPRGFVASGRAADHGGVGTRHRRRRATCSRCGWLSGRGSTRQSVNGLGRGSCAIRLGTASALGRERSGMFGQRPPERAPSGQRVRGPYMSGRVRRGWLGLLGSGADLSRLDTSVALRGSGGTMNVGRGRGRCRGPVENHLLTGCRGR